MLEQLRSAPDMFWGLVWWCCALNGAVFRVPGVRHQARCGGSDVSPPGHDHAGEPSSSRCLAPGLRQIHKRLGQEQILDPLHLGLLEQAVKRCETVEVNVLSPGHGLWYRP